MTDDPFAQFAVKADDPFSAYAVKANAPPAAAPPPAEVQRGGFFHPLTSLLAPELEKVRGILRGWTSAPAGQPVMARSRTGSLYPSEEGTGAVNAAKAAARGAGGALIDQAEGITSPAGIVTAGLAKAAPTLPSGPTVARGAGSALEEVGDAVNLLKPLHAVKRAGTALKNAGAAAAEERAYPARSMSDVYSETPAPPPGPPLPAPEVTGTGSSVTPPTGAGTRQWAMPMRPRMEPPTVTGTGSDVAPPTGAGTLPWTAAVPPRAPVANPAAASATGSPAAPPPSVSWGQFGTRAPATPNPPTVSAPLPIAEPTPAFEPSASASPYPPKPPAEPLAPVKVQPERAGPLNATEARDLQNRVGADKAARELGVDAGEIRATTGQAGKTPTEAAARIDKYLDGRTRAQMEAELNTTKHAKIREAILARLRTEP